MPLAKKSHTRRRNERLTANWEGRRLTQTKGYGHKSPAAGLDISNQQRRRGPPPTRELVSRRLGVWQQSIGEVSNPNVAYETESDGV